MNTLARHTLVLAGLVCFSCSPAGGAGTSDAVAAADAVADAPPPGTDGGEQDAGAGSFPLLSDCTEGDYVDRSSGEQSQRTVIPMGSTGYEPRCVTVRAGQSVVFEMNFTTHPLMPGVPHGSSRGATTPSLITAQSSGTTQTVVFTNPGFYPFFCSRHGHVGMAGAVRVVP